MSEANEDTQPLLTPEARTMIEAAMPVLSVRDDGFSTRDDQGSVDITDARAIQIIGEGTDLKLSDIFAGAAKTALLTTVGRGRLKNRLDREDISVCANGFLDIEEGLSVTDLFAIKLREKANGVLPIIDLITPVD